MKRLLFFITMVIAMGACLLHGSAASATEIGALVVKAYARSSLSVGDMVMTEDGTIPLSAGLPADAGSAPVTGKGEWDVVSIMNLPPPLGRIKRSSPMREEIRGRLLWPESGEVDYVTLKLDRWGRLMADGSMSPGGGAVETLPLLDGLWWKCPWGVALPGGGAEGYKRIELRIDNPCLQMIGVLDTAKRFFNALNSLDPEDGQTAADYRARVYDTANPYNDSSLGGLFLSGQCEVHLPGFDYLSPSDYSPYEIVDGIAPLPLPALGIRPQAAADSSAESWRAAETQAMEKVVRRVNQWLSEHDCDKWR